VKSQKQKKQKKENYKTQREAASALLPHVDLFWT